MLPAVDVYATISIVTAAGKEEKMEEQKQTDNKKAADNLNDMFEAFGSAMGQIFNDPKLKEKARDLGKAAKESAETLGERFKDEEVQSKFKEVGRAAQAFGKNVSDLFSESKDEKGSGDKPSE
jgi:[ribosomal protein S5]-alanine N-acetyltransferase